MRIAQQILKDDSELSEIIVEINDLRGFSLSIGTEGNKGNEGRTVQAAADSWPESFYGVIGCYSLL
jgi:hypothetical protein